MKLGIRYNCILTRLSTKRYWCKKKKPSAQHNFPRKPVTDRYFLRSEAISLHIWPEGPCLTKFLEVLLPFCSTAQSIFSQIGTKFPLGILRLKLFLTNACLKHLRSNTWGWEEVVAQTAIILPIWAAVSLKWTRLNVYQGITLYLTWVITRAANQRTWIP